MVLFLVMLLPTHRDACVHLLQWICFVHSVVSLPTMCKSTHMPKGTHTNLGKDTGQHCLHCSLAAPISLFCERRTSMCTCTSDFSFGIYPPAQFSPFEKNMSMENVWLYGEHCGTGIYSSPSPESLDLREPAKLLNLLYNCIPSLISADNWGYWTVLNQ